MKLWLLTQNANNEYDTYDSCVVAAENEDDARTIHPGDYYKDTTVTDEEPKLYDSWTKLSNVTVFLLGDAKEGIKRGAICSSFNAG